MPHVISTATSGVDFTLYAMGKDQHKPVKKISIAGGSNVANKHLVTPMGVATEVSEDDLQELLSLQIFQRQMDRGFFRVVNSKRDPEQVITSTGMETADESAPLTPESIAAEGAKLLAGNKQ